MLCKNVKKKVSRWEQAIEDAEDTIAKCQRKIESMRAAILVFRRSIEEDAPYPDTNRYIVTRGQSEGQKSQPCHSN